MGKQAYNGERFQGFRVPAKELVIVGIDIPAAGHYLADPRVKLPLEPEFVATFRQAGQLEPVKVRKDGEGRMLVVFGRQRVRAIRKINEEDGTTGTADEMLVDVVFETRGTTEQDSEDAALIENSARQNDDAITIAQKAAAYLKRHGDEPETMAKLCVALKCSKARLNDYLKLLEGPKEIVKAVQDRTLGPDAALAAIRLPPAKQQAVVQAAVQAKAAGVKAPSAKVVRQQARQEAGQAVMRGSVEVKQALAWVEEGLKHDKPPLGTPDYLRRIDTIAALRWVLSLDDVLAVPRRDPGLAPTARSARLGASVLGGKR